MGSSAGVGARMRSCGRRSVARHRGRRTAGDRWARLVAVVVVLRAPGRLVVVAVAIEPTLDGGARRVGRRRTALGRCRRRAVAPPSRGRRRRRTAGRAGRRSRRRRCRAEGGRPPLVLGGLAGVRPDAVERVALRPGGRGGGNVRRAADRAAGTTGVGEGGVGHGGHHLSARARADGRRVGTGSVDRSTRRGQRPAGAGPATAGRPKAPTWRARPGPAGRRRDGPSGDVVGGVAPPGPGQPAEPGPAVVADQDVRGVEPPVHDAEVVEVGERRRPRPRRGRATSATEPVHRATGSPA